MTLKLKLNLKDKSFGVKAGLIIIIFLILVIWVCYQARLEQIKLNQQNFQIYFKANSSNQLITTAKVYHQIQAAEKVLINKVIDGDTVEDEFGRRIRYIGIDAPEMNFFEDNQIPECYALDALLKNKALILNKKAKLFFDQNKRDKYGRLLAYLYLEDGTFINLELVKQGYALSKSYFPNTLHQTEFDRAQRYAQENKLGLWGKCQ